MRVVDFIVSFSLFLIMLTQFYLVAINIGISLSQEQSNPGENPARVLADRFFSSSGTTYDLAPTYTTSSARYINLATLALFNPELGQLPTAGATYSYVDPNTILADLVPLGTTYDFRISTKPLFDVSVTYVGGTIDVEVKSWGGIGLEGVNVQVFLVGAAAGNNGVLEGSQLTQTDASGDASAVILPTDDSVVVAYAYSGGIWGIGWTATDAAVTASDLSTFLYPRTDGVANDVYHNSADATGNPTINLFTVSYDSTSESLVLPGTAGDNAVSDLSVTLTEVGTVGPLIQVLTTSEQNYRVVTLPFIMDYFDYPGNPATADYSSNQFPVYQTGGFSGSTPVEVYSYTTVVTSDRGPFLMTFEVGY